MTRVTKKRNLRIIKRRIWISWKLIKHTTMIKLFEFGWQAVQRATCSSITTLLWLKNQNSAIYFHGVVHTIKHHKNILWLRRQAINKYEPVLWLPIFPKIRSCQTNYPTLSVIFQISSKAAFWIQWTSKNVVFYGILLIIKRHKKQ